MGGHCRQKRGMCSLATRSERKWRLVKEHVDRVWKVYQRRLDGELVAGGMLQIWKRLRRLWRRWHWVVPPESWQLRRVWRMDGRRCSPAQLPMKQARFLLEVYRFQRCIVWLPNRLENMPSVQRSDQFDRFILSLRTVACWPLRAGLVP